MKFKNAVITTFKTLISLTFLIIFVLLVWSLFTSMVKIFGDYTSTVEPTIVVAIISGLGAIIVNAFSKSSERKSETFIKSKEKMFKVYEDFLKDFNEISYNEKSTVLSKYENLFAINASDDTYNEFIALKNKEIKDITRLIVSIRNELKISNKKNKKQDNTNQSNNR